MSGSADGLDADDIAEILCASDLSDENRRHVHNAIVSGMIEGWTPSHESVTLLIEAAAGNITVDEYTARVIASAKARDRQSGQLPNTSVPDTPDDPLLDAEIVAWEGKPRD
jgi:Antitoxin VbhA